MEIVLNVRGMSCQHCIKAVEKSLSQLNLRSFEVTIGEVKVDFDDDLLSIEQIKNAIVDAGYSVID